MATGATRGQTLTQDPLLDVCNVYQHRNSGWPIPRRQLKCQNVHVTVFKDPQAIFSGVYPPPVASHVSASPFHETHP